MKWLELDCGRRATSTTPSGRLYTRFGRRRAEQDSIGGLIIMINLGNFSILSVIQTNNLSHGVPLLRLLKSTRGV